MAQNANYYVSPTGSDSNPGTFSAPLQTPQKAESLVKANYLGTNCASQTAPIVVQFLGGEWFDLSLSMTAADSGCSSSAPVIFENYPGATPIFSAGVQVLNWTTSDGGTTWQTTLPSTTVNFEALYYNGQRRLRPRLGSGTAGTTLGTYYRVADNISGYYNRFYYNPSDPISSSWLNYSPSTGNPCGQTPGPANLQGDIQIAIFEQWDVSWQRISCIDTVNHIVYLTGNTTENFQHGYITNHRYIVENVEDQLTLPGQWFVNKSVTGAWVLTYIANPGENPNTDTVVIPQQTKLFSGTGLQYRTFLGITFCCDDYVVSPTGYAGSQAETSVTPAVSCLDCSYVTFDTDIFTNIEGYALGFPTDNKGTATGDVAQNNAFYDVGAGGLLIGKIVTGAETNANVFQFGTVQNNLIQSYGRKFPGAAAITPLIAHDTVITHNDVDDGYSQGIMLCFPATSTQCQGKSNSNGGFNLSATYNHIWNLGQGILNDFGGIYMATYNAAGNVVENNKIHDISDASSQDADGYGGNGIYIDRGGPITISNNLVYRTCNSLNMTEGPPSTGQIIAASNNIFAYTRRYAISMFACAQPGFSQFSLNNNIFLEDRTGASVPAAGIQAGMSYLGSPVGAAQDYVSNDYWNTSETFSTAKGVFDTQTSVCKTRTGYTMSGWQALGEDQGSLSVNPGFVNPLYPTDNYSFLTSPPSMGFVPFNTSGTCSTCPGRNNPVLTAPTVPAGFPTDPFNPATEF